MSSIKLKTILLMAMVAIMMPVYVLASDETDSLEVIEEVIFTSTDSEYINNIGCETDGVQEILVEDNKNSLEVTEELAFTSIDSGYISNIGCETDGTQEMLVEDETIGLEESEEVIFISTDNEYISNIEWGKDGNEKTLYWDAFDNASYYIVSCADRKNIKVTKTNYDFSSYLTERGTYKASIVGYDSNGVAITYLCYSPELVIDYNTYTIKCYLTENDNSPIITNNLSINKSYKLKQYQYTDKDDDFQLEEPILDNYDFKGWSVAGSTSIENPVIITADTGNKTYIARWQGKNYNVFFDTQDGNELSVKQCNFGELIGALPNVTRENYIFDGWYTETIGGKTASSADVMPAHDITYYAHWTPINYVINLYSVEDDVTYLLEQLVYNVESGDIILPDITREGYFFNGWTGEGIDVPQKDVVIATGSSGTKKYYANWIVDPCAYEHDYEDKVIPATLESNGKIIATCRNCGKTKDAITISKIEKVSLSTTAYTYDGNVKEPIVKVIASNGVELRKGTDYIVSYKDNKNVGKAIVTISFKGKYVGTLNENFIINPLGTTIKKLYPESQKITVKWKMQNKQISGYQIEYTWPTKAATSKIVTIKNSSITSKTIKKLKNNRDYYIRVRTYTEVDGICYYSSWSSQEKVHIDKIQLSSKSITLYRGQTKKLSLKYVPSSAKVTWKSSNKKIATVSKSGKVSAKGIGKTTILAKYKGVTYKTTINVTYMKPDYGSILYDYDTRNNYFIVKIKNNSNKTMTILPEKTSVKDADYKRFDRKIYLSKSYTIKSGEMKTIKFKVKGNITWYDVTDFTLYYYFKLDGKTYYAKTNWADVSKYKSGSKWKKSYSDNYWFEDFRMEAWD